MICRVLIIEDEVILAENIQQYLQRHDYEVEITHTGDEGITCHEAFHPHIILLDLRLGETDGLEILKHIRETDKNVSIVLMTAYASVETAVDAMKMGANEFLTKPLVLKQLEHLIEKLVDVKNLEEQLNYIQKTESGKNNLDAFLSTSPQIRKIKQQVNQLIKAELSLPSNELPPPVLITGETGTGKELLAKAIHYSGQRNNGPFVELNCTTLPENLIESELFGFVKGAFTDAKHEKIGLVESSDDGTLFLDEIGDMTQMAQMKILKLLEDKIVRKIGSVQENTVNVRILAATNQNLEEMVSDNQFRSDLYFRLRIVHIHIPPLRERKGDIEYLAKHFLKEQGQRYKKLALQFTNDALNRLSDYSWPGNVRELRNLIEQIALMSTSNTIAASSLVFTSLGSNLGVNPATNTSLDLKESEQNLVSMALERTYGNVSAAAKILGISRDALRYRLKSLKIESEVE